MHRNPYVRLVVSNETVAPSPLALAEHAGFPIIGARFVDHDRLYQEAVFYLIGRRVKRLAGYACFLIAVAVMMVVAFNVGRGL